MCIWEWGAEWGFQVSLGIVVNWDKEICNYTFTGMLHL